MGRQTETIRAHWLTLRVSDSEAARVAEHAPARGVKAAVILRELLAPVLAGETSTAPTGTDQSPQQTR